MPGVCGRTARRFVGVGLANTVVDVALFLLLHDALGLLVANLVSTSAGMLLSFVANGLLTFGAGRLTVAQAWRFVASTGATLWLLQPLVIALVLRVTGLVGGIDGQTAYLLAKLAGIACCLLVNFCAYRFVVWPTTGVVSPDQAEPEPVDGAVSARRP